MGDEIMAPGFSIDTTEIRLFEGTVYTCNLYYTPIKKQETAIEKRQRVAKEKMFASWKTHNEKPCNVIQVKQMCKPRHLKYK